MDQKLDQFLMKGPVNIPSVQQKMWSKENLDWVRQFITEDEWFLLSIAGDHSEIGEGREEWDEISKGIRERLEKEDTLFDVQ